MSDKQFMSYGDSETLFTEVGEQLSQRPRIFNGTLDEYEALSATEQAKYGYVASPDDVSEDIADEITDGDMRPVTSNAVYDVIASGVKVEAVQISMGASKNFSFADRPGGYSMCFIDGRRGNIFSVNYWETSIRPLVTTDAESIPTISNKSTYSNTFTLTNNTASTFNAYIIYL